MGFLFLCWRTSGKFFLSWSLLTSSISELNSFLYFFSYYSNAYLLLLVWLLQPTRVLLHLQFLLLVLPYQHVFQADLEMGRKQFVDGCRLIRVRESVANVAGRAHSVGSILRVGSLREGRLVVGDLGLLQLRLLLLLLLELLDRRLAERLLQGGSWLLLGGVSGYLSRKGRAFRRSKRWRPPVS